MSEFKTCFYCKNASGWLCQQCWNQEYWEFDKSKASQHERFENEVRADERERLISKVKNIVDDWGMDDSEKIIEIEQSLRGENDD